MSTINREDTIAELMKMPKPLVHWEQVKKMLEAMPEEQPERKKGKWIHHTYIPHRKYCSCCKKDSPYDKCWDFCPNCGADMRGEQGE